MGITTPITKTVSSTAISLAGLLMSERRFWRVRAASPAPSIAELSERQMPERSPGR